jgi:predicted glycoside hydrolase/deacetylase ChbG (UPF0249 family)
MKKLILCADDYAIAPGVSRGILRLIEAGRISATSCLTVSRFWPEHAAWLRPHADKVDIGLHLALTDLPPLGPMPDICEDGKLPPLGVLIRYALMRQLDSEQIAVEVRRQVNRFEEFFGRPPDFIDGHQHAHQLPGIRQAVLALWSKRLAGGKTWLRVCDDSLPAILRRNVATGKSLVIAAFGRGLRRGAVSRGIPVNDGFAGIHDFSGRIPYPVLFKRFIAGADGRLVVMCHPGTVDDELRAVDPVTTARESELNFFSGDAFPALLTREGMTICRFF